ncbi:catalase HPII [soil metagenome]
MKKDSPKKDAAKAKPATAKSAPVETSEKIEQLRQFTVNSDDAYLTSNQGLRVSDDQNSLKAGTRGPSLLEDFLLREKLTHFDHERIPERVVHARGVGAHGSFQAYEGNDAYTKAGFLNRTSKPTPVFVRFSTVGGSRGSTDLARDVRGFAVKFYTDEGIFDLVGNNMPVFFIQDSVKFPDFIHAVKPEPHNEIPQASSAHDTFYDFISLSTETTHMLMWLMSDRAIPRSLRMMEGFGVHTFRLIDESGQSRFVKFHWKPLLGVHSVLWDEAVKISGKDPDFHRRDLWEAINSGAFPEWELGVQIVEEKDEFKFNFDLLDPTKLIPEELVPVVPIGKMTLNRNVDNYFAETEQVAFCISHIVPGIDFSNDPLLQGRLFSYLDTQLKRLGGPNFHELPINKSLAPVTNNQRDGHMRQTINPGVASYQPNTTGGGCPFQAGAAKGGFASFPQPVDGVKLRDRSESFFDHFSQATMFYNSQNEVEKQHISEALQFELNKVISPEIKQRMLVVLAQVDGDLAEKVGQGIGLKVPRKIDGNLNQQVPADTDTSSYQPQLTKKPFKESAALSILRNPKPGLETRKVALLVADGFDSSMTTAISEKLVEEGAVPCVVAPHGGSVFDADGNGHDVDFALPTTGSVLFDALYVTGGSKSSSALQADAAALLFINETFKHFKAIGTAGEGVEVVRKALNLVGLKLTNQKDLSGVVLAETDDAGDATERFLEAVAIGRHWKRKGGDLIPV